MNNVINWVNKTFSLDKETINVIERESKELHIGKSAFLRLLIWNYHNNKKENTKNCLAKI